MSLQTTIFFFFEWHLGMGIKVHIKEKDLK